MRGRKKMKSKIKRGRKVKSLRGRKVKFRIVAVKHYGYHQGYKVYLCGKKYPRKQGYFYATNNKETAKKSALRERRTGREQTY